MRPQARLQLKDQCLLGPYVRGVIAFSTPNLRGGSYRLCIGATTTVIIHALVGTGPFFDGFGILFSLGFFTILCASEGSRSFVGGGGGGEWCCELCPGVVD